MRNTIAKLCAELAKEESPFPIFFFFFFFFYVLRPSNSAKSSKGYVSASNPQLTQSHQPAPWSISFRPSCSRNAARSEGAEELDFSPSSAPGGAAPIVGSGVHRSQGRSFPEAGPVNHNLAAELRERRKLVGEHFHGHACCFPIPRRPIRITEFVLAGLPQCLHLGSAFRLNQRIDWKPPQLMMCSQFEPVD